MHANARLTVHGRLTVVARVAAGRPKAHVAAEMGVSRPTVHKWCARFDAEGPAGLSDRSSRPHNSPRTTPPDVACQIEALRREAKLGPARIGLRLGIPASTVHRVLARLGLSRLSWMDRPTGRVIRRYERDRPGELVHVDVKKLGRIPNGGGWRAHGRAARPSTTATKRQAIGFAYVHSAVDDHTRLAYSEVHPDERKDTCAGFWTRASAWFAAHGVTVTGVMTDNAKAYWSGAFTDALTATHARRWPIPPYTPQINGKVERFNRTLVEEWAYARVWDNDTQRTAALDDWLHTYNHHRGHTAIGGPPITRVNNLPPHYS